MKFRLILFFILGFFLFTSITYSHTYTREVDEEIDEAADTTRKNNPDSVREARAHIADSTREARTRITDSTRAARKERTDSMLAARKHVTDSMSAIRKYKDSKHYKDSVTRARNNKAKALKKSRDVHTDSLAKARKQITDSMATMRQARTDSIRTVQKRRTDSLAVIKKYKTSKRYRDSVTLARREHSDSIKAVQVAFRDSIAAVRKHTLDSAKVSRKHIMDSTKLVRTKYMDSIKVVRKARTDSLAKVKADKEKIAKAKEKKKEEAAKLKLELKIKQKREKWSNKSMLKKKWSPKRRFFQNSFTHYNYYYNSNKKMDEALLNMQRTKKENYDSLIGLFPYNPNRDSALMSADMDSIVHKVSVGIQIHDPRVKWSNDLYLLLGEAYYYKGKYENAAIAFRFIISSDEAAKKKQMAQGGYGRSKEAPSIIEEEKKSRLDFLKHKSVHNDAILWLSRTYTTAHQVDNAESILSMLESDSKLPDNMKGKLAVEKALVYLAQDNNPEAAAQLSIAANDNNLPSWLRIRAGFLAGQLLQNDGKYTEAAESFEKVLTQYPKIEMDFYTRKYIAYNKLMAGEDAAEAMVPLKKVLKDGKYVNYYDQVYYVLGQLAVKAHKDDEAIVYLTKSTNEPKATKKQKALSFAALGDVYYSNAKYPLARMAYDSATKYSSGKDNNIAIIQQRSKGLKEVAGPTAVIHDQDSLRDLAGESRKEQQATVRRYLRYLEKLQQDSIENAETAGVNAVSQTEQPDGGTDAAGWYFSNPTLMQQGSIDFKRKWGSRPLTDNWRRAAAVGNQAGNGNNPDDLAQDNSSNAKQENGLPTEESLLSKIPNTPQQKELSLKLEFRAYILLAKAYMKQLEDYNQAIYTLDTLDARFPNHNQKEEELYLRYQIAIKQNKLDQAQQYSQELVAKFPKSEYAAMLRPKQTDGKNPTVVDGVYVGDYFDATYGLIMQHQYTEALMKINTGLKQYDDQRYKKRFLVAQASAYAGMGNYDQADTVINSFLKTYPADSLTNWASTVKDYIKQVRNGGKPSWYYDTIPASKDIASKKDKSAAPKPPPPPPPPPEIPPAYAYHPDSAHYCIVTMPGIDFRTAGLKEAIKSLDSAKYDTLTLNMVLDMYDTHNAVLVVKKFPNKAIATTYMNDLLASPAMQGYSPGELHVYIITTTNYKKMFADKLYQPYATFYNAYYLQ